MPKTASRSSRSGSKSGSSRKSTRSETRRRASTRSLWSRISPERRLDLLGVLLALLGLLSFLSLISNTRGSLTDVWVGYLRQAAGIGAFVLPLALVFVGVWLVLRNIERLPAPSGLRLVGIILLYLGILTALHLGRGGGWELAKAGDGGGYIGGFFERALVGSVGVAGTVVALAAWLLVGLALSLDISIPDLVRWFRPLVSRVRAAIQKQVERERQPRPQRTFRPEEAASRELPPDFKPLAQLDAPAQARPARRRSESSRVGNSPEAEIETTANPASSPSQPWVLPPIDAILDPATPAAVQTNVDHERGRMIEETLASFGAPAHVVDISRGPTITQFGVEPDFIDTRGGNKMRVRVSKIVSLADDLALALAAPRIRIQAPVPGRNYVGIEVPNAEISRVTLREVLESEVFGKMRSPLRFALGKDVAGKPACHDLSAMPHLLIAGTTGSGKSVCVNAILACLLMNNVPQDLRLVLVDPKRVELTGYNGIPHLLAPVVVDTERVVMALQWIMREMDSRYQKFSRNGVRNIVEYNARTSGDHLPYLVIVIDELADLMMLAPDETERSITRLAQMARATGIHLIIATQRPSVDVVTGLIKANFPARIAFAVASNVDSRTILDQPGAERLLGRGDMLFQAPDASAPVRLQGVFVADSEIQRLVDYWRMAAANVQPAAPEPQAGQPIPAGVPLKQTPLWSPMDLDEPGDPLLSEAVDLVRREGRASITMLQRRLRIGYTRAARLVDTMEEKKIIGPPEPNSQVRTVLDYGPVAPPADER